MKISFITTVFNEEKTILQFLSSLHAQTVQPHEIVIVDGGSTDNTLSEISNFKFLIPKKNIKIIMKKGNRSVGRNEAIKCATGNIIVCSDAGNILDKHWLENIVKPFDDKTVDVVAGYYKGLAKTVFQKCLVPYVLVMPDKVNSQTFFPATRSMAFTKKIWEKVGRFNEKLSHNEDYAFAKQLQKKGAKIVFKKDAIVYWIPRENIKQAFIMFSRFAYGDGEARIIRKKVILLFIRYSIGMALLVYAVLLGYTSILYKLFVLIVLYLVWTIWKNYQYVKNYQALFFLPIIQFIADFAVITGTILGLSAKKK